MNVPIIALSVGRMEHTMKAALTEHAALMDRDIQAAVEDFCRPENIGPIVKAQATAALKRAIEEEVHKFFSYQGAGRAAVAEAVRESLLRKGEWDDPI